jgi:sRNA-binding regulator protein Hfq
LIAFDDIEFIQISTDLSSPGPGLWMSGDRRPADGYRLRMRWESLFADLEAQLAAERLVGLAAEVADRTRAEWSALGLLDRLRAQPGQEIGWWLLGGERLTGRVAETGDDWVLVAQPRVELLIPLHAVCAVAGLTAAAHREEGAPTGRRLPLSVVLRALARDRLPVQVSLSDGGRLDGTVDRVGADHLDLALHPQDTPRRDPVVLAVRTVRTAAVNRISVR